MNRTDITSLLREYNPKALPGYWHFPHGGLDGIEPEINMGDRYGRHNVSFTDPASAGRLVTDGPLVPGPHAGAYGKCTVIAANPAHGTWGEVQRARAAGVEINAEFGDELVMFGFVFVIEKAPNQNIKLTLVDATDGLTADEMRMVQVMTRSGLATTEQAYIATLQARALRIAAG